MTLLTHEAEAQQLPYEVRYDLTQDEMSAFTASFMEQQEPAASPYACYLFAGDTPMANVARSVERIVFERSFGNDAAEMAEEYGSYEDSSHFLLAVDTATRQPAGVIRVIGYSDAGLKSVNDLSQPLGLTEEQFRNRQGVDDMSKCWDVGTLAVLPEYRGLDNRFAVSTMLYRGLFLFASTQEAEHMVTILDEKARKGLDLLGVPLKELEGTAAFDYLGSPKSYAMHGAFSEFEPAVNARVAELQAKAAINIKNLLRPKELVKKRIIAGIAGRLATGHAIDQAIFM